MTHAELQAIVERQVEAWNRHDAAAAAQQHAAEGSIDSPMYSTRQGRTAIEEAYRAFFRSFPDAAMTIEATLIDPPRAAVFTTVQATHMDDFFGLAGTGRRFEFRGARLFTLNDEGLIVHERRIYDFTGLLVQLGVLRAKPAKP
jgi:steroid delta-isomerase-like uncharacterized protein